MKSIADQLPPEIARQIHPDRRKNEAAYWIVRDQLLAQYQGQWIGFADGMVIAAGNSPVTVFHAAEASGRHPFFICVGREEEPCRIRRAAFPYDASYFGEALPLITVEFRRVYLFLTIVIASMVGCAKPVDLATIKPGAAGFISWSDAQRVMSHPDVRSIMQLHSLTVVISMKDGTEYRTKEPQIDAVFKFVDKYGRNGVVVMTE